MKRLFNFVTLEQRWILLLWIIPPLLIILALVWVLFSVPANAYLRAEKMGALWFLASSLLIILPGVIAGIYCWRSYYRALGQLAELGEKLNVITEQAGLSIRLYPEGFNREIDYPLITRLFHDYKEVRLYPLPGGFSGALVFQVDCWDRHGVLQQPMVLKLGSSGKIAAEEWNYNAYVRGPIGNTVILMGAKFEEGRGAILFTYARMGRGKVRTFEEFYLDERNTTEAVVMIINSIFQHVLQPWLGEPQIDRHSHLYQIYSLTEDWEKICRAVHKMGFDPNEACLDCLGRQIFSPLMDVQTYFEHRQNQESTTRHTIVHGDLNARNILIDNSGNVFVIDFARTKQSHLLRDFCKLETELKFCLTRLHHSDDIEQAVALEKELLLTTNEEPFETLESLLNVNPVKNTNPHLERAQRGVVALRRIASQAMGLEVNEPAEQYYLGLLHYTLDTLRYEQCDRNSKLYALISASLLCRALR